MVEHFGSGTLVDSLPTTRRQGKFCLGHEGKFEPASLTIRLHALSEPQHQEVVDYIDYCHKGLKEQMSTLSSLLPRLIADGPPSTWLVIEIAARHELPNHSFEELFKPSEFCDPSRSDSLLVDCQQDVIIDPSLEQPTATVDPEQADAVHSPPHDREIFALFTVAPGVRGAFPQLIIES